jgi:hypothetical protein
MKKRFGDLTTSDVQSICYRQPNCRDCPLFEKRKCFKHVVPAEWPLDKEIDLLECLIKQ